MRTVALMMLLWAGVVVAAPGLDVVVAGDHRTPAFAERDEYRNPQAVLEFFGLQPDQTVVEIWPGTGWWTEILAPYLRPRGTYYAAGFAVDQQITPQWRRDMQREFENKLAAAPPLYDKVLVTGVGPTSAWTPAPAGSADLVLTFRNVHNWLKGGYERQMFDAFFATLKPGGVLGVVEHRAPPEMDRARMEESGYVTETLVIELAEAAGFRLDARSELNANPLDLADHPAGVWTLPPTLRHCRAIEVEPARTQCTEKYRAIGESDRMTLRFLKPN